jgi:hypothetical protein
MTRFTRPRLSPALLQCASFAASAVVCTFLLFPSAASAAGGQTGNLSGTVVDVQTTAPLVGALISVASPSASFSAKSDAHGYFAIVGVPVDTYTISVQMQGYETETERGVTVMGDQTLNLRTIALHKLLRTIGKVSSRPKNSAFQPTQTEDSVTISGSRIVQTTGKVASTDEQSLILAAPGTSVTSNGNISIRGGLATEVGYQFDGVDYTEPFFAGSGSNGKFNGLGALQVVEGPGDATQGNVGGGVVNVIPKRGSRPAFGFLDFEAWSPNFGHQFAFEYGAASANGRLSNYVAYNGQRDVPYFGYRTTGTAPVGNFYGSSFEADDDVVNNFVYKFGRKNNQSLQVLYQNRDLQQWGNVGGLSGQQYYPYDPASYTQATLVPGQVPPLSSAFGSLGAFQRLIGLAPGVPASDVPLSGPELLSFNPTRFLKVEYTRNISSTAFLSLRTYNWNTIQGGPNDLIGGNPQPGWQETGGSRSGVSGELIKQLSVKHTLTLAAKYENQHPIWDEFDPYSLAMNLVVNNVPSLGGGPGSGIPTSSDFISPRNGICPLTKAAPGPQGCYLAAFFPQGIPRIPIDGFNYHQADFKVFGFALRDQWSPSARVKFDLGLREDGANYQLGGNPLNPDLNNPTDVSPSSITSDHLRPRVLEPRAAVAYQMGARDALRFGYGRSVVFANAQSFASPAGLSNYQQFVNVPPLDHPGQTFPACGSGTNDSRATPVYIGGKLAGTSNLFYCQNYAQSLFWLYDQQNVAPDIGDIRPATQLNYDFTFQHQFRSGVGVRLTPFYKRAYNLPSYVLLNQVVDPKTGQVISQSFNVSSLGLNRTAGAELGLTMPDRDNGLSGFVSLTYQNVFNSTPPLIDHEDSLPVNSSGSLVLGDLYRAGYVSPFLARLGFEYKTESGWRINPILQFDVGFPYNIGSTIASNQVILGSFRNIPQVNLGPGTTQIIGFNGLTGSSLATQYVDPAFPGSILNPNIAATRGTPESSNAGGLLSRPELNADLTLEYAHRRNTFGILVKNVFGNVYYGSHPTVNPYYQPVTTGVAGPGTGKVPQANPGFGGGVFNNRGFANVSGDAFGHGPYLLLPNRPMTFEFYYQRSL